MTVGWDNLTNGSVISAVTDLLNYSMGDWWLALLLLLTVFMVYATTRSEAAGFLVVIAGVAYYFSSLSIVVNPIFYALLVFGLAFVIFYFVGRGE